MVYSCDDLAKLYTTEKQSIMKKVFGIISFIVATLILFNSNTAAPDIVYWDEHGELTWDDFKGYPAYEKENISALTASGIVQYTGCKEGRITYMVQAYFERNESWVKSEALTDYHLAHEQLHFDITELYARKIRKALAERRFLCGQETEFNAFVAKMSNEWQMAQLEYDKETEHSINHNMQKIWHLKIEESLEVLDAHK